MAEYGNNTTRSSHPLNIFKKGRVRPLWAIEGASERGGRKILAHHGLDDDGVWRGGSEDQGSLADDKQPFFYLHFFGGDMAMTDSDMKEVIDGMKDRRAERAKANGQRPLPDLKKMREQLREAQAYLNEKRRGVTRFSGTEIPHG